MSQKTKQHLDLMILLQLNNKFYYIKYSALKRVLGTDKTDNLTCEIIFDNFTCENYHFSNNHQS